MADKKYSAESGKRRRHWFQFRLRTLLIVMALVATFCGYVAVPARIVAERSAWIDAHPEDVKFFAYDVLNGPRPKHPMSLIRRLLGDQSVYTIYCTADDHDDAAALFPEAQILEP